MSEIDKLRQEAEELRSKIRVSRGCMNLNWGQVAKRFKLPSGWGGLATQSLHVHIQLQKEEPAYLYSLVAVEHTHTQNKYVHTMHTHKLVFRGEVSQCGWVSEVVTISVVVP